jgi:hypothetical protein
VVLGLLSGDHSERLKCWPGPGSPVSGRGPQSHDIACSRLAISESRHTTRRHLPVSALQDFLVQIVSCKHERNCLISSRSVRSTVLYFTASCATTSNFLSVICLHHSVLTRLAPDLDLGPRRPCLGSRFAVRRAIATILQNGSATNHGMKVRNWLRSGRL